MTLTVLGPHIFVRPDTLPDVGDSGLVLVHGRRQATMTGTVVAVGEGPAFVNRAIVATLEAVSEVLDNHGYDASAIIDATTLEPREHLVRCGDRVLFSPESGEEVCFEREHLIAMLEDQVIAVIDQKETCDV